MGKGEKGEIPQLLILCKTKRTGNKKSNRQHNTSKHERAGIISHIY